MGCDSGNPRYRQDTAFVCKVPFFSQDQQSSEEAFGSVHPITLVMLFVCGEPWRSGPPQALFAGVRQGPTR